jgi:hypothetical protein
MLPKQIAGGERPLAQGPLSGTPAGRHGGLGHQDSDDAIQEAILAGDVMSVPGSWRTRGSKKMVPSSSVWSQWSVEERGGAWRSVEERGGAWWASRCTGRRGPRR